MWKRGILVSPCPPVRPPVRSFVDGIVHSKWNCPLCTLHNIHFIFLHLIKQLQKVYRIFMFFLAKFQHLHFWQFVLNLLLLLFCLVFIWNERESIKIDSVCNHLGCRVFSERRCSSCSSFILTTQIKTPAFHCLAYTGKSRPFQLNTMPMGICKNTAHCDLCVWYLCCSFIIL